MPNSKSKEIKAILNSLSDSITIFADFIRSIPADKLNERRGDNFWSILEHADHLADVQSMIFERMQKILSEDMPEFIPFIPDQDAVTEEKKLHTVDEIVEQFKSMRTSQLELLNDVNKQDWQRKAIHPEYDQYGLFMLARHVLMHDHWHMYRMEELWLTKNEYLTKLEG